MKILLATLHAKYVHSSLALPALAAACADLPGAEFEILELTVNEHRDQLLSRLVDAKADVALFSCYIWNAELTLKLASDLKKVDPQLFVVLGGPEVSFGSFELMQQNPAIDCIVRGEGEVTCRRLLEALLNREPLDAIPGLSYREDEETVANPEAEAIAELDTLPSPFQAGLADLSKPLVYYETSRGCPFSCAFCLSSLEKGVRSYSYERIEADLGLLMKSGVRTIKFVDRTFNYDAGRANRIWRFILENNRESKFHFEIAADLLTEENIMLLAEVPPELFRFEIGVQSGGEETLAKVERKSSLEKVFENVRRLKEETWVTVHLDLVAGLPGESFTGFLSSLQSLFEVAPDHIQVEPLKVMKGTRMRSIARSEKYAYSDSAPYKVLQTPWLTFAEIRSIENISRLLDLWYNSGRFATSLKVLAEQAPLSGIFATAASFFENQEMAWSSSLPALFEAFNGFAATRLSGDMLTRFQDALAFDYCLVGYPGGTLPSFFGPPQHATREPLPSLPVVRKDERVRYYRRTFARNYRTKPWLEEATTVTFVYRSAPGEGLTVQVM
ncbi:B12-binding domain-containing radical SAM protein [Geomonas sp. Red32]|uniref:B12-binding domain-containing radical SAM protein n=1 Tax=Geomonas sp. Red32 TaxID=2912856 RepID=UPI00202CE7D3|nr:B12-binding domain-containing radical SAM protein [Geomonas sp. Red32]MCM0084394.1 B12-binding domain-containing radical SAM protein [Geomonas sp. Red32]